MTIIVIKKQNEIKYGSSEKIAPYLNMSGQGIRKWIHAWNQETDPEEKKIKSVVLKNGWMVYLEVEKL